MKSRIGAFGRATKNSLKRAVRGLVQRQSLHTTGLPPEYFDLTRAPSGALGWAGVDLAELARSAGTPLHVVNPGRLRANVEAFQPAGAPPREVFYSYKTNPVPGVLRRLHGLGVGAEVISHYELWLALKLGVQPERIIYNGPAKSPESVRLAIERDILLLNLNHREEASLVAALANELGRRPRVGLRVTTSGWAGQFGTPVHGGHALEAYREALDNPNLDVVGLHVHRGGMMRTLAEATQFVDEVLSFLTALERTYGKHIEMLDLGGSLCSPSVRPLGSRELRLNQTFTRELEPPAPALALRPEQYTRLVTERVESHFRAAGVNPPRVFFEPGRAVTSDAQLLLTRVVQLKKQYDQTFAILDAGINLAESCRSEYHQILRVGPEHTKPKQIYTLVGPICTPGDTLRWATRLPELAVGDTLAIMDAGAYFVPFSTAFSFPRAGLVEVENGNVTRLRHAETFADMTHLDVDMAAEG